MGEFTRIGKENELASSIYVNSFNTVGKLGENNIEKSFNLFNIFGIQLSYNSHSSISCFNPVSHILFLIF